MNKKFQIKIALGIVIISAIVVSGVFLSQKNKEGKIEVAKVEIYDTSFMIENDLDEDQIIFNTENVLSLKSYKKVPPYYQLVGDVWSNCDVPGSQEFHFNSIKESETFIDAVLYIYKLSPDIDYNEYDDSFPLYLMNLRELEETLSEKPQPNRKSQYGESLFSSINNFPPTNAASSRESYIKYIKFREGSGVRFILPGYFHDTAPAHQPEYIYQGITDDEKYHIIFRYKCVHSPKLKVLLDNSVSCDDNTGKFEEWVDETFSAVATQEENEFIPKLSEIDKFIKSIKIMN